MTQDSLKKAIAAAQQRLESLLHRATGENSAELLREAIAEVSHNLEELQVLAEELEAQNEELTATRAATEAERQRYQDLFKFTPDGYVVTDSVGTIQQANPAAAQLLNTQQSYLVGKPLVVFVHPEQRRQFRQILTQLRQQEQIRGKELWMFHPERKIDFPAELTGVVMRDTQGKLISLCFLVRDISVSKRLEIALQKSEAKLNNIINSAIASIVSFRLFANQDWEYEYQSAGCELLFGYTAAEIFADKNLWISQVVPEDLDNIVLPVFEDIFASREVTVEYRFRHKNGSIRWIVSTYTSRRDETADCWVVTAVSTDISDRKRVEAALSEKEEQIRLITDGLPAYISYLDAAQRYQFVNKMYELRFGLKREQICGKHIREILGEDAYKVVQPNIEKALTGTPITYEAAQPDPQLGTRYTYVTLIPDIGQDFQIRGCYSLMLDITERKCLELALQQSEAKLNDILNNAIASIVSLRVFADVTWEYDYYSPSCEAIFGFTPQEMMTGIWWSRIPPEDQQSIIMPAQQYIFAQQPTRMEYRFLHKDGTLRWFCSDVSSRWEEANGCFRVIAVDIDITDRKRAEAALAASEQKLRGVLNTAGAAIARFRVYANRNWEYEFYSAGTLQLFGYTPEEMAANNTLWISRIHPEDLQNIILPAYEDIFAERTITHEYRFQRRDGEWIAISETLTSHRDETLDCWLVTCIEVDITERKQAEDQLAKMSTALSNAVEGISFLDTQRRYVTVNQAYANMVGYFPEEMIGMLWHSTVHSDDLETMNAAYQQMLTTGKFEAEARGIRQDGSMFYKQIVMVAAYDNQKQLIGHYCFMKDISDRKQAEIELQKAKQAAEAANVAKSTFLANMSHELRTPLNAILGFTQMMARDRTLSSQQQEQVKIINNAGDHLLALINDILEMSKIEAGRTSFNPTSFDLINFLLTLEELFKFKAESKGLQLKFELAPNLPQYIQTDEGKLRQVLINLIGNAIKFTQKGQVTLRANQEKHQKNTNYQLPITNYQLIFEIEDTGPGIDREEINRIFDPFTQSETGRKAIQGTGLGLAISLKFVQMMGGNIKVNSQPKKGSLFTFDIQVTTAEAFEKNTTKTLHQIVGLAPNQPEYRILVVDDHPESRLLLTTLLSSIGFQVSQAANGQEAVSIWSTWKPHLICMDMRMPVMDGIQATQQIRTREKELLNHAKTRKHGDREKSFTSAWEAHFPTIIIALTANAFESDKNVGLAAGCDDYISKPLQQNIVLEKIIHYLEINYIYDSSTEQAEEITPKINSQKTKNELQKYLCLMPEEWLSTLNINACIGNDNQILKLIEQIPPEYAELANAIAKLTDNFEFDKIIELTQK